MTYLVERLAELRRHLDHLRTLRPRASAEALATPDTVAALERLPDFRNVLVHEYVALDLERAVEAMDQLGPVEELAEAVRRLLVK